MNGCARWSKDIGIGRAEPYDVEAARLKRPRKVTSWAPTGKVGAFSTMDVGIDPNAVYWALARARAKHAAFKEQALNLNAEPDHSGIDPEPSTPSELPLPPRLGVHRPGWLASAIRNIGRRRTA